MENALLTPTCHDCRTIGRHVAPMLVDMEAALGPDVVCAFLTAHGGRPYQIPNGSRADKMAFAHVNTWLRDHIGYGVIGMPKGPLARNNRVAWSIYCHLRDGQSLNVIAGLVDCELRTVSRQKVRCRALGLLASQTDTPTPKDTPR